MYFEFVPSKEDFGVILQLLLFHNFYKNMVYKNFQLKSCSKHNFQLNNYFSEILLKQIAFRCNAKKVDVILRIRSVLPVFDATFCDSSKFELVLDWPH